MSGNWGTITKLPSGRYRARYTGPDHRRHAAPTTFTNKSAARAWLNRTHTAIQRGEWADPDQAVAPDTMFGAYAEQWLQDRPLKPGTRHGYRKLLDAHILPSWGNVPLTAISAPGVRTWHANVAPGKETTRAHAYGLLRAILQTAVSDGLLDRNPANIRGAGTAKRVTKTKVLGKDELTALMDAMPDRYKALVAVSVWCALRFGEATELRRKDVDLDAQVLHIRRGVVRVDGEKVVSTPKSAAGVRDVAIPAALVPMLAAHLDAHAQPGKDGLLFPAVNGGHLATSTLYKSFYKARDAIGRPDLRWHDLRHSGAVFAALSGANLRELMGRLGHSTPQAALRYQHVAEGRDAEIAARLSQMMGG